MPYTLTKQEKEFIRRQYQENVRIINSLLPPEIPEKSKEVTKDNVIEEEINTNEIKMD